MDFQGILNQILVFVDPLVVFATLVISELIKRVIPYDGLMGTPDLPPVVKRLMPIVPIVVGIACMGIKSHGLTLDIAIKGFVSGSFAAYIYRTYKVSILGE